MLAVAYVAALAVAAAALAAAAIFTAWLFHHEPTPDGQTCGWSACPYCTHA